MLGSPAHGRALPSRPDRHRRRAGRRRRRSAGRRTRSGRSPGSRLAILLRHSSRRKPMEVHAVDQDPPLGRLVEAAEQLDEGRLAGAVLADDRHRRARREPQVDRPRARRGRCPGSGSARPRGGCPSRTRRPAPASRATGGAAATKRSSQSIRPNTCAIRCRSVEQGHGGRHLLVHLGRQRDGEDDVADRPAPADRVADDEEDGRDVAGREARAARPRAAPSPAPRPARGGRSTRPRGGRGALGARPGGGRRAAPWRAPRPSRAGRDGSARRRVLGGLVAGPVEDAPGRGDR